MWKTVGAIIELLGLHIYLKKFLKGNSLIKGSRHHFMRIFIEKKFQKNY